MDHVGPVKALGEKSGGSATWWIPYFFPRHRSALTGSTRALAILPNLFAREPTGSMASAAKWGLD